MNNRPETEVAIRLSGRATLTDASTGIAPNVTAGDLIIPPPG